MKTTTKSSTTKTTFQLLLWVREDGSLVKANPHFLYTLPTHQAAVDFAEGWLKLRYSRVVSTPEGNVWAALGTDHHITLAEIQIKEVRP